MVGLGPTFWDDLLEFIEERRVIPVIGAELLRVGEVEPAPPLHAHIARRLAQRLGMEAEPIPDDGALNHVVYLYLKGNGRREDIYPALRAVMKEKPVAVPRPLRQLAGILDFTLFVTTTFDSLLEQALNEVRGLPSAQAIVYSPGSVEDLPCPLRKLATPTVFYLLGRLSATPDYVITEEDTLEFLSAMQGDKQRPELLFDELKNNHLLLLGCGFPDWLARFFIRLAKGARLSDRRDWREVVADQSARRDPNLVLFLEHFSYRTKVFAEGDAAQFVDELSRRWGERHPAPALSAPVPLAAQSRAPEDDMPRGAIFLSYASEDRTAVERLHAGLTSAGIEVWFDRHGLEAGDLYDAKIRRQIKHEQKVPLAQSALRKNPADAGAMAVLGDWYAFRGFDDWAVDLLEKARAGGAAVDPLTLARCYWELSDDIPPKSSLTRRAAWPRHSGNSPGRSRPRRTRGRNSTSSPACQPSSVPPRGRNRGRQDKFIGRQSLTKRRLQLQQSVLVRIHA